MPDAHHLGVPSSLRPPPPRATTPLPASFRVDEDASLRTFDDGTILLGGSPLHLFRLTAPARAAIERWRAGAPVGPGRQSGLLARRLVSAGALSPRPPGPTMTRDDVTVVVPVRDRPDELDRLLGALEGLACIVVDDASADPGATAAIAARHGARLVALPVNLGPSGARNAGLQAAASPLVAFVDSDCEPRPGWLAPLLGHFDDPVVAAVAPRVVPAGDHAGRAFSQYEAVRSPLDLGPTAGQVRPRTPIPFIPSAALIVRSDLATGAALFDPALRGGEDVDLVWRLTRAGWDVRYAPTSAVDHHGATTLWAFLRRQAFYGSTAAPLARRHPGNVAPAQFSAWSLAAWLLVLARRPQLALAALLASVAILARRLQGLVRDPVAVAARIAGGGTVRAALPSLSGLVRVWSPLLLAGLAFGRTRRAARRSPWSCPLSRTGQPGRAGSTRHASPPCTSPTTPHTASVCGPAASRSGRSSHCCHTSRGAHASGHPRPFAATCTHAGPQARRREQHGARAEPPAPAT